MATGISVVLAIVAIVLGVSTWQAHRRRLVMRAAWGQPRQRERLMGLIAAYHVAVSDASQASGLAERTARDLHLDTIFTHLDRAESTVGQQLLYHRLRTSGRAVDIDAFEALSTQVAIDAATRERLQLALRRLHDPAGYLLMSLTSAPPDTRAWHVVFTLLATVMVVALLLAPWYPVALFVAVNVLVVNVVVRGLTASRIGASVGVFREIAPLLAAAQVIARVECPAADAILAPLREALPRTRALRRWASWAARPSADPLTAAVFEYLNLALLLDANAFFFGSRAVRRQAEELRCVLSATGTVDAALAVASFRAGNTHWCRPTDARPGTPLRLVDVRHPLLADAVANTITLGPPSGVLVTGANMSGKSTLLRTIGVNVVLAQALNTCFAASYEGPELCVHSLLGRLDDLAAGKSSHLVDVEVVLDMVAASESHVSHLFLLDELFRGTNTVERVAAAEAVLAHLVEHSREYGHVAIAATHDDELVALLADTYVAVHLRDTLNADGLSFHYTLAPGPATSRNAIALLDLHGAPRSLVARAEARARSLHDLTTSMQVARFDVR